jgi:DNA-binding XRE family transcriptional regulator
MARVSFEEFLAGELIDPEFRRGWERTAVGRALALWLLDYRERQGLSQTGLAARAGVPLPTVARLEAGETTPTVNTLLRLSRALGEPIELRVDRGDPDTVETIVVGSPVAKAA